MPLILVGAPLGGRDLSTRAAEALATADAVCCGDPELAGRLLQKAGSETKPLVAASGGGGEAAVAAVLARLAGGERIVVVSDAGHPVVADLGERLVRATTDAGHPVEVVPGPSAAVAALVVSGLATDRFAVEGFLPPHDPDRSERLAAVAAERRTLVVHEASDRLGRTLADLAEACGGDRQVAVVSELTEPQETVWRGPLAEAAAWAADSHPQGEVVLVLAGAPAPPPPEDTELEAALHEQLAAGTSPRDAAATIASRFQVPRRRAYQLAIGISRSEA